MPPSAFHKHTKIVCMYYEDVVHTRSLLYCVNLRERVREKKEAALTEDDRLPVTVLI